jgi:hypothetical protein
MPRENIIFSRDSASSADRVDVRPMATLSPGLLLALLISSISASSMPGLSSMQGLTLVHFSAQPEPFMTQTHTLHTP